MNQEQISTDLRELMVQQFKDGYNQGAMNIVKSLQKSLESIKGDYESEGSYDYMIDLLKRVELEVLK